MSFLGEKNRKLYCQKNIDPNKKIKFYSREDFYVDKNPSTRNKLYLEEKDLRWLDYWPVLKVKNIFYLGNVILFIFLFFIGGIFLFIRYQENSFSENRLEVQTDCGNEVVSSGEKIACQIRVENKNKISLDEVTLRVSYSDELELVKSDLVNLNQDLNFGQVAIGKLKSGEKKFFSLEFNVFGQSGSQIFLEAMLRYKLSNFGVMMEKNSQFSGFVKSSPLAIFLMAPNESAKGEVVEYQAVIKNESEENFSELFLKIEFPAGFSFLENTSTEEMIDPNFWRISDLRAKEQRKISFKGMLSGVVNSSCEIKFILGKGNLENFSKYAESSKMIKIIPNRIELIQKVNGKETLAMVNDGQTLEFKIIFKNNSSQPLSDLILKQKIKGFFVDEKKLNLLGKGFYDSQKKEIIWKASDLESLAVLEPQQSGEVSFLVYLKENLSIENISQINQEIVYQSEIESLDINSPLGENKKIISEEKRIKINSNVSLELFGSQKDPAFISFGPMPMEEGVETSVVLKMRLKNSFNDLKNVLVKVVFPSRVSWKNNFKNSFGKVSFNERTNELIWDRGEVRAGTGYYLAEDYLYFQIGVTPSKNDSLKELIKIVNTWQLTAEDVFTGQKIVKKFSDFPVGRLEGF